MTFAHHFVVYMDVCYLSVSHAEATGDNKTISWSVPQAVAIQKYNMNTMINEHNDSTTIMDFIKEVNFYHLV